MKIENKDAKLKEISKEDLLELIEVSFSSEEANSNFIVENSFLIEVSVGPAGFSFSLDNGTEEEICHLNIESRVNLCMTKYVSAVAKGIRTRLRERGQCVLPHIVDDVAVSLVYDLLNELRKHPYGNNLGVIQHLFKARWDY